MNNGWIKLHRSLLEWEWWSDMNVRNLWLTILLLANHDEKKWQGQTIASGQLVTSLQHLAVRSGLSIQQTRTALDKLKSTGEINTQSTNKNTIITVIKWADFQCCDEIPTNKQQTDNKQITNEQQTDNKQITTNKNVKNIKNEKNIYCADEVIDYLNSKTGSSYRHSNSARKHILGRLNEGFTVQDCKDVIDKKCMDWKGTDYEKYLVPDTLFRPSNFEKYLNQRITKNGQGRVVTPVPDYMQKQIEELDNMTAEKELPFDEYPF